MAIRCSRLTFSSIWQDTLLIPVFVAGLSLAALFLHGLFILVRRVFKRPAEQPTAPISAPHAAAGVIAEFKAYVKQTGGAEIFAWKFLRFLGSLALLGLWIATILQEHQQDGHISIFGKGKKKHWRKHPKKVEQVEAFDEHDWVDFSLVLTYAYTSILALWTLVCNIRRVSYVSAHLGLVLLASWSVFFYRDVWPLGTYDLVPLDIPVDRLFWPKFVILTIVGVVTPLLVPNPYIPVDPNYPSEEPAPEQTASLLSFMLFSFLDRLVWTGYHTTHLAYDLLPPMADYDRASWLKQRAFKHLDPFLTGKKRHVIWGFMSIFKSEYGVLMIMITVRTATSFLAPIGVNRLLSYIETGGTEATVRPWVWIVLMAIGPLAGSIAMQVRHDLGTVCAAAETVPGVHFCRNSHARARRKHPHRAGL